MTTTINRLGVGRFTPPSGHWHRLFEAVPIAPLVFFRLCLGAVLLWEVWRYFEFERITRYYNEPTFLFSYWGFDFVQRLPPAGMIALFHGLGVLAFCVMVGLAYRLTMPLLWAGFTYVFLLDQAQYLNHFYLISLVCGIMCFVPAHRAGSVDAWLYPALQATTAPRWSLWWLRGQMAVVYGFGGIAKLNGDWLHGEPLRLWLSERPDFPLIGVFFTQEWLVYLFSYGGLLFDLFIVPMLLWHRTRWIALWLALGFHLTNSQLFNIGVFPWLAMAYTLLFLPPQWFTRTRPRLDVKYPPRKSLVVGLALYFAVQVLLPLRHWLYVGDVSWTEEGHNLAWHMRLRAKQSNIWFFAYQPTTGVTQQIQPLTYIHQRQLDQMAHRPDLILQFSHFLKAELADTELQIFVWAMSSLNTRPPQLLIDPTVDMSAQPRDLWANQWVLPLLQPLHAAPVPMIWITPSAIVNMGVVPFSLADLTFTPTTDEHWHASTLQGGECLLLRGTYAPCNQVGALLLPLSVEAIWYQTQRVCATLPCAIALPSE